jgi:hypothetical protein
MSDNDDYGDNDYAEQEKRTELLINDLLDVLIGTHLLSNAMMRRLIEAIAEAHIRLSFHVGEARLLELIEIVRQNRFPERRVDPQNGEWLCDGCGASWERNAAPMLDADLWALIGGKKNTLLCFTCTERRVQDLRGRPLLRGDLADCPYNESDRQKPKSKQTGAAKAEVGRQVEMRSEESANELEKLRRRM